MAYSIGYGHKIVIFPPQAGCQPRALKKANIGPLVALACAIEDWVVLKTGLQRMVPFRKAILVTVIGRIEPARVKS